MAHLAKPDDQSEAAAAGDPGGAADAAPAPPCRADDRRDPGTVSATPAPTGHAEALLRPDGPCWEQKPATLRLQLGEFTFGSLTFPARVLEAHFTELVGGPPEPVLPPGSFPPGVELIKFPSYPVAEELPRWSV